MRFFMLSAVALTILANDNVFAYRRENTGVSRNRYGSSYGDVGAEESAIDEYSKKSIKKGLAQDGWAAEKRLEEGHAKFGKKQDLGGEGYGAGKDGLNKGGYGGEGKGELEGEAGKKGYGEESIGAEGGKGGYGGQENGYAKGGKGGFEEGKGGYGGQEGGYGKGGKGGFEEAKGGLEQGGYGKGGKGEFGGQEGGYGKGGKGEFGGQEGAYGKGGKEGFGGEEGAKGGFGGQEGGYGKGGKGGFEEAKGGLEEGGYGKSGKGDFGGQDGGYGKGGKGGFEEGGFGKGEKGGFGGEGGYGKGGKGGFEDGGFEKGGKGGFEEGGKGSFEQGGYGKGGKGGFEEGGFGKGGKGGFEEGGYGKAGKGGFEEGGFGKGGKGGFGGGPDGYGKGGKGGIVGGIEGYDGPQGGIEDLGSKAGWKGGYDGVMGLDKPGMGGPMGGLGPMKSGGFGGFDEFPRPFGQTKLTVKTCNKMMDSLLGHLQTGYSKHIAPVVKLPQLPPTPLGGWGRISFYDGHFQNLKGKICRAGNFKVIPQGETVLVSGVISIPEPRIRYQADAFLYSKLKVRNRPMHFCAKNADFRFQMAVNKKAGKIQVADLEPMKIDDFHFEDEKGDPKHLVWPFNKIQGQALEESKYMFANQLTGALCEEFRSMVKKPEVKEEILSQV